MNRSRNTDAKRVLHGDAMSEAFDTLREKARFTRAPTLIEAAWKRLRWPRAVSHRDEPIGCAVCGELECALLMSARRADLEAVRSFNGLAVAFCANCLRRALAELER